MEDNSEMAGATPRRGQHPNINIKLASIAHRNSINDLKLYIV